MEADIYQELQSVARDVLAEFSQGTHRYVEIVPGNGPVDNPGEPSEVLHTYEGVSRGVSFKYLSDSNVSSSNLQTTMPGTVVPAIHGFIQRPNGSRGKITKIDPKPASGTPVAFVVVFEA